MSPMAKQHPKVFHLQELVDEQGEVAHVFVGRRLGDDHFHAVDVMGLGPTRSTGS